MAIKNGAPGIELLLGQQFRLATEDETQQIRDALRAVNRRER
jgi:hypothetical protein